MNNDYSTFTVTVYGEVSKYNDVLSKARCRIFYKYGNRNGIYIPDEAAESMLATLPYTPIKGIYSNIDVDYGDHGKERDEGRIYGIVPESPNVAWEPFLDKDGVTRTYACADVLLFTAIYKEANDIVGKAQSMELFPPSMEITYGVIDGQKWAILQKASFLGLQVLGEDDEPCFEGSSFYTLQSSIENIIKKIEEHSTYSLKGGNEEMGDKTKVVVDTEVKLVRPNFRLNDFAKYDKIWDALNANYSWETGEGYEYQISAVYDDYAIVYNNTENKLERAYYTKDDKAETVTIDKKEDTFMVDVNTTEKAVLDTLQELNGATYEVVNPELADAAKNAKENSEFVIKNEELEGTIATLTTEKEKSEEVYALAKEEVAGFEKQIEELSEFKLGVETKQKESIFSEYEGQLEDSILDSYKEKSSTYTVVDLDKELAYEFKKANSSVFSKTKVAGYVPNNDTIDEITAILSQYKK